RFRLRLTGLIDRTLVTVDVTVTWTGSVGGASAGAGTFPDLLFELEQQGSMVKGFMRLPAGGSSTIFDRRTSLAGTLAVLLAAPLAAEAQPPGRVAHLGLLSVDVASFDDAGRNGFVAALREMGWVVRP